MNRQHPVSLLVAIACLLGACAHTPRPSPSASAAVSPTLAEAAPVAYASPCADTAMTPYECDRRSILAMAGEFRVRFAFDETAALAPGYAPHPAQRSGATEFVEVVEDGGHRIVLQHILVMRMDGETRVIKHWRQDWLYEPQQILRYQGRGRFTNEAVPAADARGAWAQLVYEVDDAPRYAGIGHWTHADGVDAWTSGPTLRPLPRREYTKRADYLALEVINRHTLTPAGWVHEQDNTKLAIESDGRRRALARERGINSYTRIADFDFTPGREYWSRTAAYWASVRAQWTRGLAAQPSFVLAPDPNGEPRVKELFAQAERVENGESVSREEIEAVLVRYGLPLPDRAVSARP